MKSFKLFIKENAEFSKSEIETIKDYTSSGYHNSMHDDLHRITRKNKTKNNMKLYIGLGSEKSLGNSTGKEVTLKGFQSATIDRKISRKFSSNEIIQLHHPKGSYGAYIEPHSDRIVPEKEFLLPKDHKIKILKTEKRGMMLIHHAKSI